MSAQVEIIVGESAFSIVHDGREYFIISVDQETEQLSVSAPLFDEVEFVDLEEMPTDPLKVNVREHKKKIARLKPTGVKAEPKQEVKRGPAVQRRPIVSDVVSPLEEWEREEILRMVVKSWMEHPKQDKTFTAQESHRIATSVFGDDSHHNVMRVAGVRAALTRGSYDLSLDEMVENMSKEHYDSGVAG